MAPKKQLVARTDSLFDLSHGVLQAVARQSGMTSDAYMEGVLRHFFRSVRAGEVDGSHIHAGGTLDRVFRGYVESTTLTELELCAAQLQTTVSGIIRTAVRLEPEFRWRINAEQEYTASGATGNPALMSDTFLRLWQRHRQGELDGMEAAIFKYVRPLQLDLCTVKTQLQELSEQHARPKQPPTRSEIVAASHSELQHLARDWGFQIPKKTAIAVARRMTLVHFGYSTTE